MAKTFDTVLTTINAPHVIALDAETLALCLKDISFANANSGHMSCFFGEVPANDQIAFAASHDISLAELKDAAKAFAAYTGEHYHLAA